jgi:hypothetical protein
MTGQNTVTGPAVADAPAGPATRLLRVWRGDKTGGGLADYMVSVHEGEVVLDVLHRLQATLWGSKTRFGVPWDSQAAA